MVLEAEAAFHLLTVTEWISSSFMSREIRLGLHPTLQWLKFQIQFMVDLHNAVSLLEFRKDPQNPLF
ncbi:hypothetical protein PWJ60_06015 [Fructilactobacillus sanfranciscensis]